jgi:hypothetical protein
VVAHNIPVGVARIAAGIAVEGIAADRAADRVDRREALHMGGEVAPAIAAVRLMADRRRVAAVAVLAMAAASLESGAPDLVAGSLVAAGRTVADPAVGPAVAATFPSSCTIEFSPGNE